ncbi:sacsin N-terminal ATP-binding-like domain-containing protein [Streptomyces sp. ST1015]|uniref:sacsin N-terminal ATP-binding-like domain-containing protein n=1 Tax=unclassified Streptomyces TaxID=2593676 RepID=UPI001CA77E12|nr:molecular chaperone Hsp90 [Streptomyces sp. ST1015]QZZ28529.1 molecular chaperone Hsp90 [Streptomyces sp. ST1015]
MSNFVRPATEGADPFGTARLRRGVLDAWATSPARFREDANAEEDLVLGGYRDRLIVELAQNAADAAARAGVPGRLRLTLREGVLVAANTGAPLDAAGVESLATLRASAKRDTPSIGRFGVGFAAVLSVTDEPAVVGRHGGVRWSLAEARELAADTARHSPGLGDEVRRRDGHVPVLRLPYAAEGTAPDTYDTAVILPLRDTAAADLAERLLDAVDDSLLLTLPGLQEVVVEVGDAPARTLWRRTDGHLTVVEDSRDGTTTWRTLSAHGETAPDLLADRPVEERLRPHWSLTWAVPVDTQGLPVRPRTAPVLHAPTPSDEPLGVPALLIASFPLDTTRRHAAPGPLTDFLVQRAADTYAQLLADWRPVDTGIIDLVPGPLGKGELDGALRQAVLERLPRTAFLPPAAAQGDRRGETAGPAFGVAGDLYTGSATDTAGSEVLPLPGDDLGATPEVLLPEALRPRDAEIVEGAGADTVRVLAEVLPTLLPAGLERRVELRTLGVTRVPLADVIDRLAGLEKDPDWWYRLYDSLAGTDPDRLSGLPVPLTDGRTTIGPRQILLPLPDTATGTDPEVLARLGLKVAHEDAAHPLLEKLGALPATPRAVLTTPQVRAAVAASLDDDGGAWDEDAPDAEELADTVLALVRAAGLEPGDEPWLGALALPDEDGELVPAGELVLPGSPFASVIRADELAEVDHELAEKWGEQPLTACGVLANFALVRATDVVLDPDELEPREGDFAEPDDAGLLDAVDVWAEDILDRFPDSPVPPVATELVAVRDLDLVDDDKWPQALALLAQPPLRDALVQPLRILLPDGTHEVVRPYTAWWLRGHPVLDGRRPAGLLAAGGDPLLRGLYDEADATGFDDEQVLRALGVRTSVSALLEEPGGAAELLERLADPDREVTPAQLHGLYGALADLDPEQVTLPDDLRAVVDGSVDVVDAADAVVVDSPDLLPFTDGTPLLPVRPTRAAELAELFQVRRLSESVTGGVDSEGAEHDVPDSVAVLLGPRTPKSYVEHDELIVDGVEIDWRLTDDGVLHASTLEGVAAGLAWAAGQWPRRFEVAALLEDPSRTGELARDRWFD